MSAAKITPKKIRAWRADPVLFVQELFHVEPDPWQAAVLRAFPRQDANYRRQAMQACVGPGKSAVLAWCGWNFLACYARRGEHPKGVATSCTYDNLKDNLWAEFAAWYQRSEFLKAAFEWTKERIFSREYPETWFLSARAWPKSANADEQGRTLSGLHAPYVLALIDESGGIPLAVLRAADQALSSCKWGKIMQAGNPVSLDGMLYAASTTLAGQWHVTRVTGDPDDPGRSPRIGVEWARKQIADYGRDNPWVMSQILGLFPPASINSLLGPDEVAEAMKRDLDEQDYGYAQKRLGVDVARFGDDRTAIFPRQGLRAFTPTVLRNARTHDIAARVAQIKGEWGGQLELVDNTGGYGAGVVDALMQGGHNPVAVEFSGKPADQRYLNKRAEMWFLLADWVKRGGWLPNDPELGRELTAPTFTYQNGRFRLEEKVQIKARLGFSPDLADALALTFGVPDTAPLAPPAPRPVRMSPGFGGARAPDERHPVRFGGEQWKK